jgi:hypothetical protein
MVNVEFEGIKELMQEVEALGMNAEQSVKRSVRKVANRVYNQYRKDVGKHNVTGKTQDNIELRESDNGATWEVAGSGNTNVFLEFGTAPHEIKPKRPGGSLSFFWPVLGQYVTIKKVLHPGTKAHPYLFNAYVKFAVPFSKVTDVIRKDLESKL